MVVRKFVSKFNVLVRLGHLAIADLGKSKELSSRGISGREYLPWSLSTWEYYMSILIIWQQLDLALDRKTGTYLQCPKWKLDIWFDSRARGTKSKSRILEMHEYSRLSMWNKRWHRLREWVFCNVQLNLGCWKWVQKIRMLLFILRRGELRTIIRDSKILYSLFFTHMDIRRWVGYWKIYDLYSLPMWQLDCL